MPVRSGARAGGMTSWPVLPLLLLFVSVLNNVHAQAPATELCPLGCLNNGRCTGFFTCTCDSNFYGPRCAYKEPGTSLTVSRNNNRSLTTSLGELIVSRGSGTGVTLLNYGISLMGLNAYLSINSSAVPFHGLSVTTAYGKFTVAIRFSVSLFNVSTYVICTGYSSDDVQGVNLVLTEAQQLILQFKLPTAQWEIRHQFESQDRLKEGVLVEFSFDNSTLSLYVDGKLVRETTSTGSSSLTQVVKALVIGFPEDGYNSSNISVGLTILELIMWTRPRDEIVSENVTSATTTVSLDDEVDASTPSKVEITTQSPVDEGCDVEAFVELEKTLVNLTISVLFTERNSRTALCASFGITVEEAEASLANCSKSATVRSDSTSIAAFLKYTQTDQIDTFSAIQTSLCDGTVPEESSTDCDLAGIRLELLYFYQLSAEYGRGRKSCSLLWTTKERLSAKLLKCGQDTRTLLSLLSSHVTKLSGMACSPSTCNTEYALTCVRSAQRLLATTSGMNGSEEICRDLKLSLACATNHTIDCNGASYNLLFEHVHYVRARYQQACRVQEPEPICSGRLSVEDGQLLLLTSTFVELFPAPVLCSLWQREEWIGERTRFFLSPLAHSFLKKTCSVSEEPASCTCNPDAVKNLTDLTGMLRNAALSGASDICNVTEDSILMVFELIGGCEPWQKSSALTLVSSAFISLCGRELQMGRSSCSTKCDIAVCQQDVCGDVSGCLAQNADGCEPLQMFENVVRMQQARDSESCNLPIDEAVIQLPRQPVLTKILQCLRPITRHLAVSALPVDEYCNSLEVLYDCLDHVEVGATDDRLRELTVQYSRALVGLINNATCSFLPDKACGAGTKADVVFILDASGSVGDVDFQLLLTFVKNVLKEWDIEQDRIRIGVMKFSTSVHIEFQLTAFNDKDGVLNAIGNIEYIGGFTNTASALKILLSQMFTPENGDREDVPNFGIVITDGKSGDTDATKKEARQVQQAGITLLSVGVGEGIDADELENIASRPKAKHVFTVSNYSQLADIQSSFLRQTCAVISEFLLPYSPSEGEACPALNVTVQLVQGISQKAVSVPFYSLESRQELCSNLPELPDFSGCEESVQKYITELFGSAQSMLQQLCHLQEPIEGCDTSIASSCLQELANAFILPGMSACSLYSKVEVCVQQSISRCSAAIAWPILNVMGQWKRLAESTCCKGLCDPAEAVLCLLDVQHMAKSPVPDWQGICSVLDSSVQCAERNVAGCDRCQQDTIKTITGKINSKLIDTCRDPPENKCRALAATNCKEKLSGVNTTADETSRGFLCLKVFEARKCIRVLTEECDAVTKLTLNIDLETVVTSIGGESCEEDKIRPVCYQVLVDHVQTILSFDPLDPSDPAYKYQPSSQDDAIKESDDDKDDSTESKENGDRDDQTEGQSSKENKPGESLELVIFPTGYLGHLCREAQLAYACVHESLDEFPPTAVQGLVDVLNSTWSLAWLRCIGILEPLSCYSCNDSADNEACNSRVPVVCGSDFQMCKTEVQADADGEVLNVEKGCVVPLECKPGCKNGICTFCCDTKGCNQPDDGPLTGTCNLTEVAVCLSGLSGAFMDTDKVNCSLVQEKAACVEHTRAQCELNGEKTVGETLSGFLGSTTVKECQVDLSSGRCGLYAVASLGSLLSSISDPLEDLDLCPLLLAVERERLAAETADDCEENERVSLAASVDLFRSQLWSLDCGPALEPQPMCSPVDAFHKCLNLEPGCSFDAHLECISNYTEGCQPVQRLMLYGMLRLQGHRSACDSAVLASIPSMPVELQPLDACLQTFSFNFTAALSRNGDVRITVDSLLACLLTTWDVQILLSRPPAYKLYLSQLLSFLQDVLVPAVQPLDGDSEVNVTMECQKGWDAAARGFLAEVMLMIVRPFGSFGDSPAFCNMIKGLEITVHSNLTSCTAAERTQQLHLLAQLQHYRLAVCADSDPIPQCSPQVASQCVQQFTGVMDTISVEEDESCSALNDTVSCVKVYTAECPAVEAEEVNLAMYQVISTYRSTCPEVVVENMCSGVESLTAVPTCSVNNLALDKCDSAFIALSCAAVEKAVACYKKEVGSCAGDSAAAYKSRFIQAFPVHTKFAASFCGLDLTSWSIADELCTEPVCDVHAAEACFDVSDITESNLALSQGPSRIVSAAGCLRDKISGCDVFTRARIIFTIQHQVDTFIRLFPVLVSFNLQLTMNFTDPFGSLVPLISSFMAQLNVSFTPDRFDLLPLCWWLYDFSNGLSGVINQNNFFKSVFGRGFQGLQNSITGVCNDPEIIGVILNLPDKEDVNCPAAGVRQSLSDALFEAVFTGVLWQKSRIQMCQLLKDVVNFDLSSCSAGLRQQVKLLTTVVQHLAGEVCELPRYCRVKRVQRCVLELVGVVQGLGTKTSTQEVCSSINVLDTCVRRFSYRCDDASSLRIKRAVQSVRIVAEAACGETVPQNPLPDCIPPVTDDTCDLDSAQTCSFGQVLDLLSTFANEDRHCRSLKLTRDCYKRVTGTCQDSDSDFALAARLPAAALSSLQILWHCKEEVNESVETQVCREGCQLTQAKKCIASLTESLQFWNTNDDGVCSMVTTARQCLIQQTQDCDADVIEDFQIQLKAELTLHSSLISQCVDVYTCLTEFTQLGRRILSKDSGPIPSSANGVGDSTEKSDQKAEDQDSNNDESGEDSETSNRGEDVDDVNDNLFVLCQRIRQSWNCVEKGLGKLSSQKRSLLNHIFQPLWAVLSERCSNTVQLQCYKCSDVLWESSDKNCTQREICAHSMQSCSSQYRTEGDSVYITRGCLNPALCHAKDKKDNSVSCCYSDNCNTNADFGTEPDTDSLCFVEYAADCAFTFAEGLVSSNSVQCSSSFNSLQCVAQYTENCPAAQSLHTAASQLMLTLAQTWCVQGSLSEGCQSIAVSSMEAILTNAYSVNSACSGLRESSASVDLLEQRGKCTTLDLIALRQSLSFAAVITHTFCNPEECKLAPLPHPASPPEEEGEKKCDYLQTSLCGRKAVKIYSGLNLTNQDHICSEVDDSASCAVRNLQGCKVTPCLQSLVDAVKKRALEDCSVDYLAPEPTKKPSEDDAEECQPSILCDIEAALTCVDMFAQAENGTDLCKQLEMAANCRYKNVTSCRSLQNVLTAVYFENTLGKVMETCSGSVTIDLTPPSDVYETSSDCVDEFMEQMSVALMADEIVEPVCAAAAAFKACPKYLPALTQQFIIGDMLKMVAAMVPEELCSNMTKSPSERRKRETEVRCSKDERKNAIMVVTMSSFFTSVPLDSRPGLCVRLNSALEVLSGHLSPTCASMGLSNSSLQVLTGVFRHGFSQYETYCVAVLYEPAGCKPEHYSSCLGAFTSMSSAARVQRETQCRAAESAMECVQKFSKDCPADQAATAFAVRDQVRAVVGNICPNLTLGLFCPDKFQKVINNFTCSFDTALECLPTGDDLGGLQRVLPNYCSELKTRLECTHRGLQGCLQSQVDNVTAQVERTGDLSKETAFCRIEGNIMDFNSVCLAHKPCSISTALACLELVNDVNHTDCSGLSNIRTCIDSAVGFCSAKAEAVKIAYDLFFYRFGVTAPPNCTAPFSAMPDHSNVTLSYSCAKSFLQNLRISLEITRSTSSVCDTFMTYVQCMRDKASDSTLLAHILDPPTDFINTTHSLYCQAGGVDASVANISSLCNLHSASYCIATTTTWVLIRHLLPNSDNQMFCQDWNKQAMGVCVKKHSSHCASSIQSLLDDAVEIANRLVMASGACDTISTCFLQEAYYNINQFSVAVSTYTLDSDKKKLCIKKQDTEANVDGFTATCNSGQQSIVSASLSQVTRLVEEMCEDVVLPAPPICPNLPIEQQRCSIGAAFSCIIKFNTNLLSQGPSLIWRDWCTSLESTIQCAAFNTSSCNTEEDNLQMVVGALDDLRQEAGYRCPWLAPDLCTRTPPCPAQYAGCDITLQINLLNSPLDDVCMFIQQANECIITNTATCTRAQVLVAERTITRRLEDLSIPSLTCDSTEVTPCLLQARAASWQLLTQTVRNDSKACGVLMEAALCWRKRVEKTDLRQVKAAGVLTTEIENALQDWCVTPGMCGDGLALVMNSIFDWAIHLAVASDFDQTSFCSTRQAILADIVATKELYSSTCSLPELDGLVTLLNSEDAGYATMCNADTAADCNTAAAQAQTCLDDFNITDDCSSLNSILACLAPSVGLCDKSASQFLVVQFQALLEQHRECARPPIIGLSTSVKNPLYLSEQGGVVDINFQVVENFEVYTRSSSRREVRIRAQVQNIEPPKCLGEGSADISQISVLYDSGEPCGVRLAGNDSSWNSSHTIRLVANQDGRQDGTQQTAVSLYADIYEYGVDTDNWLRIDNFFKLAEYQVTVEDIDLTAAVCSSVGNPHTQTFDGTLLSNNEAGEFLLYRNTFIATAVTVSYQQCAVAATCTCAVEVYAIKDRVRFDRCRRMGATGPPEDVTVTMLETGPENFLSVYRHEDLKTYFVVLRTGTVVKISASGTFLKWWIIASSLDQGKTEGMCGLIDGNAYNDLIQPNGQRYITKSEDIQYGVLSPREYINQWRTSELTSILSSKARVSLRPSCSCLDASPSAAHCAPLASVSVCDIVQGQDITALLVAAANQNSDLRQRRAVEDQVDFSSTIPTESVGWLTARDWTEATAREHCERELERVTELRYCDKAILTANGTFSYADLITVCMENIRVSGSDAYQNSTTSQAMEKCRSLFLRNTTYQNTEVVRPAVVEFLDHTCNNSCHGNGDCQMGVCRCYPGYVGGECSYHQSRLPRPINTAIVNSGLCRVSASEHCQNIFITGQDFVNSALLTCHIQSVVVSSAGKSTSVGQPLKIPAELVTATLAHCKLARSDSAQQSVAVAISNDGIKSSAAMLFSAYDPRCYSCDASTHQCTHIIRDTCEIEGQCFLPHESSPLDRCLFCNPLRSANQWSYRDLPECEVHLEEQENDSQNNLALYLGLAAAVVLVVIFGVVIVACIIKKRSRRKTTGDQELENFQSASYLNAGYTSDAAEPQEFFNRANIHKRAVTRMAVNYSTPQTQIY